MVCLMNEFSASDGDLFPYRFQHYKLGKLIGKRSWGGVVGIRGTLPLLDGGTLNRPEFSPLRRRGQGVDHRGLRRRSGHRGRTTTRRRSSPASDEQLNKGIEVILEELKTEEKELPKLPPFPKR